MFYEVYIMTTKHGFFNRQKIALLVVLIFSFYMFGRLFYRFSKSAAVGSTDFSSTVIVIDAGHGGFDPGAVYGGVSEKDINLRIASSLAELFRGFGYSVVMTRSADASTETDPSLSIAKRKTSDILNRVALAEKYSNSVLISIHQNAFQDSSQHGTQIFYGVKNKRSEIMAELIRLSVKKNIQPDNSRSIKKGTSDIYILKNCKVPTVLVECGFMTNKDDMVLISDEEYIKKLVFCIFSGYIEYESSLVS